jgi:hypothetical protein
VERLWSTAKKSASFLGGKRSAREGVLEENHVSSDHRSRPLEERLARIFYLNVSVGSQALDTDICRSFMKSTFYRGQCYPDTIPALQKSDRDFKIAVVFNSSRGSPADLQREEIVRVDLHPYVDVVVTDRNVG